MDWENLIADEETYLDRHYTEGRSGRPIEGVTVHHMAGDLSLADCHRVWQGAPASAHYAVDRDGRIGQMVHDRDTAWACGDWDANCRTISVEHANSGCGPWTVHEAAMDAGAHLVAAICHAYGLGRPEWGANVWPHCHWAATACPGELWGSQRDDYMARCQRWYDAMEAGEDAPAGPPAPQRRAPLDVDGTMGPATVSALQRHHGTPADGVVSGQSAWDADAVPSASGNWEFIDGPGTGSLMVEAVQAMAGADVDGCWGHETSRAFQAWLIGHGYSCGPCGADGYFGHDSACALQRWLNDQAA